MTEDNIYMLIIILCLSVLNLMQFYYIASDILNHIQKDNIMIKEQHVTNLEKQLNNLIKEIEGLK